MTRYRIIISSLWWGLGLAILLTFLWISANPHNFGAHREAAVDWIIPHLIPTMTLTGAVAFAQPGARDRKPSRQLRFAFLLTVVISLVYLTLVAAAVMHAVTGWAGESERGALDVLHSWNKILGVLQGLAASAIGVFFVRGDSLAEPATPARPGRGRSRAPPDAAERGEPGR
jgi:hypothetical protein